MRNLRAEVAKDLSAFVTLLHDTLPIPVNPLAVAAIGEREGAAQMINHLRRMITDQTGVIPAQISAAMIAWVNSCYIALLTTAVATTHANAAEREAGLSAYEHTMAHARELYEQLSAWRDRQTAS